MTTTPAINRDQAPGMHLTLLLESNSLPSATAGTAQHRVGYATYQLSTGRKLSLDWYKKQQNELTED